MQITIPIPVLLGHRMVERASARLRRRQALSMIATAGTAALAGCSTLWDQTGATDVVVHNAASETKTVEVSITPSGSDDPHTARTLEMAPHEQIDPVNDSKLPTNTDYTVAVAIENGPSETFEWTDPTVERAPLWIVVDDSRNIKFLLQSG